MELIEKATIIHYHRHRIKEFGDKTIKSLGWKGDESQAKRFDVITTLADFNESSVMDLGCGRGDLRAFLGERFKAFAYIGIDQMPEFIKEANQLYGELPDTFFYQSDFTTAELPKTEYVIACGALGYRCSNPHFYFEMIAKMYASAKKALTFNMLDVTRFPDHPLLVGHDVNKVLTFCQMLCPKVELIQGYLDDDFTIFMRRS